MTSSDKFGLSAALSLPVASSGEADVARLVEHSKWCLDNGCGSVTVFGSTGEGASLGLGSRRAILDAMVAGGIHPGTIVGGVAASAVEDAVAQARLLLDAGCRALLLAPPFYFKGITEDGLFAWFAAVFEELGPDARDVLLYNIPSVTSVPLPVSLITRLREAFPQIVAGVKDSSGDMAYSRALLATHRDLVILIGDERGLAEGVRLGAQGAISGMANVCPGALIEVIGSGREDTRVSTLVGKVRAHPVVAAVKALIAHRTGDKGWLATRPPLVALDPDSVRQLGSLYDELFLNAAA